MSDRDKAGLRGTVKTVSQGTTRNEFDQAGRLILSRWLSRPPSEASETIRTQIYDSSGRLLTETERNQGGFSGEKVYSYDNKGRMSAIVDSSGDRTSFEYDEQNHKIETRNISPKLDSREGVAIGVDLIFAAPESIEFGWPAARNATTIKTFYDEHDRPTETEALDADGNVLSRIFRAYDDRYRIIDMRITVEDPTAIFSDKRLAEMMAQSAVRNEAKAQLKKAFAATIGDSGRSYAYDSNGRLARVVLREGFGDCSRTYIYNEHGDVAEERTSMVQNPRMPTGVVFRVDENGKSVPDKPPSEWPLQPEWPQSVIRYKYQYDNVGNWTEQTVSRSEGVEHTLQRELTYY